MQGRSPRAGRAHARTRGLTRCERRPCEDAAARVRRAPHRHHHRPRLKLSRCPLESVLAGVFLRPGRSSLGAALFLAPLGSLSSLPLSIQPVRRNGPTGQGICGRQVDHSQCRSGAPLRPFGRVLQLAHSSVDLMFPAPRSLSVPTQWLWVRAPAFRPDGREGVRRVRPALGRMGPQWSVHRDPRRSGHSGP
ncbi:Uncharacterised protein [Amycolatopsis camponoti]|uniref:Uncharacterized protein n=1 Tax=Amycolatopsis camponoti TaxID=2606593 RepID=A0A6I8M7P5_9PSEU|nr:Uncharacterised protein [Amycolatopsis camponoti]